MLIIAIAGAFSALFSSCAKLPAYQSVWVQDVSADELTTPDISKYYSAENKIKYGISNNESTLFVRMEIEDQMTQMKFIRTGFKMYLDTTARKRQGQYIEYPVGNTQGAPAEQRRGSSARDGSGQGKRTMDLPRMLSRLSKEVVYHANEESLKYDINDEELPFDINIRIEGEKTLIWEAAIPLAMVGEYDEEKGFSIGLVSGAFEMPSGMSGGGQGASMGGAEMSGGGRPGGGGSGGGRPGGSMGDESGSRPSMDNMQSMSEPIEMWFRVSPVFNK